MIGRALVPVLAEQNDVIAVSRHAGRLRHAGLETATADVMDSHAVRRGLDGVDVVYYLVHSLGTSDFSERDRNGASTVARKAERASVTQIVYLGGLGDDNADLSPHLRSRIETATALASGSVPVTTLRVAVVVGRGSAASETIVSLVDRLPAMIAPKWVATPTQPIALEDVVRYLVGVERMPEARGQSFDVGGPDVLSYKEMIERIAHIRGRRRLVIEVPVLSPRLSSYWLHLVTPVRAGIARPLIEGLRNPTVVRNDRLRALLPFPLTSFDDAARAAVSNGSAGPAD